MQGAVDETFDRGLLLVPSDPLNPRRADPHFEPEAAAARAGGLQVALVDHDVLSGLDSLSDPDAVQRAVRRVPESLEAIYRGWMLGSEQYAGFAAALATRGVRLRTSPDQYLQAHELPSWYAALAGQSPQAAWTTGDSRAGFDQARATLGPGPAVLRDYTKSMKHYWHEAVFIAELADADAAWAVASRFRELRDDDFTGGFVLRRFERFVSPEIRTWWMEGRCRLIGPHPDSPEGRATADPDLDGVAPLVEAMGLPFVTVDLARRDDGAWRVIELGDGQVSDRPRSIAPETLIEILLQPAVE